MTRIQEAQPESGVALVPGVDVGTQTNLVLSVLVVLLVFFVRRAILAVAYGRTDDHEHRYRWAKVSANVGFVVTALVLVQIWFTISAASPVTSLTRTSQKMADVLCIENLSIFSRFSVFSLIAKP